MCWKGVSGDSGEMKGQKEPMSHPDAGQFYIMKAARTEHILISQPVCTIRTPFQLSKAKLTILREQPAPQAQGQVHARKGLEGLCQVGHGSRVPGPIATWGQVLGLPPLPDAAPPIYRNVE